MKKFYQKNKKICIVGFMAMIVCFSYIVTYNMPDYLGIEPFYSFLNNISISYLAAVIFFVVQVYIPSEENEKKSLEILKPKIQKLIEFVEVTILVYEKFVKIKNKGIDIDWTEKDKIYFKYNKKGNEKNSSPRCYTKQEMLNLENALKHHLDDIRDSSVFRYCEYEIIHEMTEIEESKAFRNFANMVLLAETEISFSSMDTCINKIRPHIECIKKKLNFYEEYELEDIESGEKVIADLTRSNIAENFKSIDIINRKMIKEQIKDHLSKELPNMEFDDDTIDEIVNKIYIDKI